MKRVRIRPSKTSSALGMVVGLIMAGIGLFVLVPLFGSVGGMVLGSPGGILIGGFAVLWTLVAATIAIYHAVNVFSQRGIATTEIDVEGGNLFHGSSGELPFDERLRRLEQLREEELISEQEYQQKRDEVMRSQW